MFKNKMADDNKIFLFALLLWSLFFVWDGVEMSGKLSAFWVREVYRRWQGQGEFNNLVQELRGGDRELYFR